MWFPYSKQDDLFNNGLILESLIKNTIIASMCLKEFNCVDHFYNLLLRAHTINV